VEGDEERVSREEGGCRFAECSAPKHSTSKVQPCLLILFSGRRRLFRLSC
jgi:hypothetical protein